MGLLDNLFGPKKSSLSVKLDLRVVTEQHIQRFRINALIFKAIINN
jgi:hypothetical protein